MKLGFAARIDILLCLTFLSAVVAAVMTYRAMSPNSKTYKLGNRVITVEKLPGRALRNRCSLVEAFDSSTPTPQSPPQSPDVTSPAPPASPAATQAPTVPSPSASSLSASSPSAPAPGPPKMSESSTQVASVSLVTPSVPAVLPALFPAGPAGAIGNSSLPTGQLETLLGKSSRDSGPGPVTTPFVCKSADKLVWFDNSNKRCAEDQRKLYSDPTNKVCLANGKCVYVSSDTRVCNLEDRSFYDGTAPQKLRTELEILEARRREIAQKLNIDLDVGVKLGCTRDDDCNVLNWDVQGKKNVCRSDNTCYCQSGSGVLCQHPSNYKDTRDMSAEEKQRFKAQNDLSKFTVRDYFNWLMLYKDDIKNLSDDHVANLKRFLAGDSVTKSMIPKMRESPPPSAQEYLSRLWTLGKVKPDNVELEAGGPFMPYNWNSFSDFAPPKDIANLRIINVDVERKQNAEELAYKLTPKSDRLLTGKQSQQLGKQSDQWTIRSGNPVASALALSCSSNIAMKSADTSSAERRSRRSSSTVSGSGVLSTGASNRNGADGVMPNPRLLSFFPPRSAFGLTILDAGSFK